MGLLSRLKSRLCFDTRWGELRAMLTLLGFNSGYVQGSRVIHCTYAPPHPFIVGLTFPYIQVYPVHMYGVWVFRVHISDYSEIDTNYTAITCVTKAKVINTVNMFLQRHNNDSR